MRQRELETRPRHVVVPSKFLRPRIVQPLVSQV